MSMDEDTGTMIRHHRGRAGVGSSLFPPYYRPLRFALNVPKTHGKVLVSKPLPAIESPSIS